MERKFNRGDLIADPDSGPIVIIDVRSAESNNLFCDKWEYLVYWKNRKAWHSEFILLLVQKMGAKKGIEALKKIVNTTVSRKFN